MLQIRLAIDALPLLGGVDVAGARISRILFEIALQFPDKLLRRAVPVYTRLKALLCLGQQRECSTLLIAATSPALVLKAIKRKVGRRTIRPQYPRVPLRVLPISPTPPSDYASGYCGWGACSNQFEMRATSLSVQHIFTTFGTRVAAPPIAFNEQPPAGVDACGPAVDYAHSHISKMANVWSV
ncbi:hypothetical protein BD779DRAFT_1475824 [Infundibulicybe gibba]|nr:hypothetical protein BD779DRAFT_1475824 [Infundibulicybe gibba]